MFAIPAPPTSRLAKKTYLIHPPRWRIPCDRNDGSTVSPFRAARDKLERDFMKTQRAPPATPAQAEVHPNIEVLDNSNDDGDNKDALPPATAAVVAAAASQNAAAAMAAQNKRAANDGDSTKVVEPQTPEGKLDQTQPVPTNADGNNETASRSAIDLTDLESKRVPDLRAMCRGLNLRAHGRKHALITRIREAQQDRSPSQTVVVLEDDIDDDDVEAAHASPHHETQD